MRLFNTIKKDREYWLVDQVKEEGITSEAYREAFGELFDEWRKQKIGYLSLLMDQTHEDWLLGQGFRKISVIVEYTKELAGPVGNESEVTAELLADSAMTDAEFAVLYDRCRSGSANKNNLFTIEQIMDSLSSELGFDWRNHCFIFQKNGQPVGISIPHIEQGTKDEGRLFYFGVLPECRGEGYGTVLHRLSLGQMQERFGAAVYVGSTDENNRHMIGIFERNGCRLRDKKGIYRIDN